MACGEITLRRLIRRGGPLSVTPAAAAVSNAVSRLSGMDERERAWTDKKRHDLNETCEKFGGTTRNYARCKKDFSSTGSSRCSSQPPFTRRVGAPASKAHSDSSSSASEVLSRADSDGQPEGRGRAQARGLRSCRAWTPRRPGSWRGRGRGHLLRVRARARVRVR
eukprot:scaffold9500_cov60-Phaeocystis_antarctica.AAC.3